MELLPKNTIDLLAEIKKEPLNFNLALNKYSSVSLVQDKYKFSFFSSGRLNINLRGLQAGFDLLKNTTDALQNYIKENGFVLIKQALSNDWNLAIGLGGASVYETGMTLHHIYGVPYIPASSLKGVVRSYVLTNHFISGIHKEEKEFDKKLEETAEKDAGFRLIFGTQSDAGKVCFYDAYPAETPKVAADVMNPHYPEYYGTQGKKEAHDFDKPNPVFFLVVKETKFTFLASVNKSDDKIIDSGIWVGKKLSEVVSGLLTSALTEHGIGAKTAVGYGYFRE